MRPSSNWPGYSRSRNSPRWYIKPCMNHRRARGARDAREFGFAVGNSISHRPRISVSRTGCPVSRLWAKYSTNNAQWPCKHSLFTAVGPKLPCNTFPPALWQCPDPSTKAILPFVLSSSISRLSCAFSLLFSPLLFPLFSLRANPQRTATYSCPRCTRSPSPHLSLSLSLSLSLFRWPSLSGFFVFGGNIYAIARPRLLPAAAPGR